MLMKKTQSPPVVGWLDPEAAAAYLSLSARTLENWRAAGVGPAFVRIGRRVRYAASALDEFVLREAKRSAKASAP